MANIFPIGIFHGPAVGVPTVIQGTLVINVPSINHGPAVGTPSLAHINLDGHGIPSDQQAVGFPQFYSVSSVNESWTQVETQLPEFIREDHPEFVKFMQEFFRWRERSEGPLYMMRRLLSLQNIDTTTKELMEYFFREYAPTFSRNTALSPSLLLKNIRQFYLAKGTEKSFKFLFRVFFGQDVSLYYPRLDILRFSDGKWIQDRTIKCILNYGDPSLLVGNRVIGVDTKASAFVEKVLFVQDGTISSYELFLNRSSISGKFNQNEILKSEDGTIELRLLPIITKIQVTVPGLGYESGQLVEIFGEGFNCKARINSVGDLGEVQSVQIFQFGAGYSPLTTTVNFPIYPGVTAQAFGVAVFDTITKYAGYFLNTDGQFSSLKALQDSDYYSQWSYVVKSEQSKDQFEHITNKLVHPAGFIMFSEVSTESFIDASAEVPEVDGYAGTEVEIFYNYQYDWNQFDIVAPQELMFVDAGCSLVDTSVEIITESIYDVDAEPLGPTWKDLERWKFDYRPTPTFGLPNDEILAPGYYSTNTNTNTPIKAFADVKLADVIFTPLAQIDHLPEATVTQEIDP